MSHDDYFQQKCQHFVAFDETGDREGHLVTSDDALPLADRLQSEVTRSWVTVFNYCPKCGVKLNTP